jgi:hypothetical protein
VLFVLESDNGYETCPATWEGAFQGAVLKHICELDGNFSLNSMPPAMMSLTNTYLNGSATVSQYGPNFHQSVVSRFHLHTTFTDYPKAKRLVLPDQTG